MPAAFKSRINTIQNVNQGVDEFYDFIGYDDGPFTSILGGGGQINGLIPGGLVYYPGSRTTYVQYTGDAVAYGTVQAYSGVLLYGNTTDFQIRLTPRLNTTTISTANYKEAGAIGFFETPTGLESGTVNGVYFYWNGAVSNNYICKVVTPTSTSTFTTPHTITNEDLYLRINVNPNSSSFYINNVLVYNALHGATELIANQTMLGLKQVKLDNGAALSLSFDAIKLSQKLSPNRQFRNV